MKMNISFRDHKYWLVTGGIVVLLLIALYQYSVFTTMKMEITRGDAREIAQNFLLKSKFDIAGFKSEVFLNNSPVENRYLLKKLGNTRFKEFTSQRGRSTNGWVVLIHQNLPKQLPQTTYYVYVSSQGNICGFQRNIPDTARGEFLTPAQAKELIHSHISEIVQESLDTFKMVESKEENYTNRKDYSFRLEKAVPELNAKYIIKAVVQGGKVGSVLYYFEVPQVDREYFGSMEAIYGTVSAISIVILMLIAFYLFLKKYHQGEIWLSLGRNVFIFFFTISIISLINEWPGMGMGAMVGNLSFGYVKLIVFLINGLIIYFFLSLLIFASWTVGESYARSLWPDKLKGMDAFFKGHFFTLSSGVSLFQGLVIGGLLALSVLAGSIFLNTPNSTIFISPTSFHDMFVGWLPALGILFGGLIEASIASIVLTFFIVNISYQRWKKKWISILLTGFVTTLGFAVAATPPSLNSFGINLISYFAFGCFLSFLYFRFNLLTVASGLFYFTVIEKAFSLFSTDNSFFTWNVVFVIIAILIAPVVYVISMIRKEEFILENYGLPTHIQRISERERLKKEMEIAAKVQLSLLPKEEPKIFGYDIAAISIPAVEAGGDYFDFVKLSGNKTGIAIGDVSGKGIGAAIYMTLTKGILQAHAEEDVSPRNVLAKVNRLLYKTIEKNSFVSMFYAILDVSCNKIIYARAGHNPGILTSQDSGGTKLLLSKGMALGLEEGAIFSSTLKEEEFELKHGDVCVLYTDGFTEAMNEKHELYGEDRLIHLIEKNRTLTSRELMNLILKEVNSFVAGYPQHDDMTIVILKRI
jgi:hypothetical protein